MDDKNALQIFKFEDRQVRVVVKDGEPWLVAKDVCDVLGYKNSRDAVIRHVDELDKGVAFHDSLGGEQEITIINESGLYSLILSSKLPDAKKFKRWVTYEVLPSIRKHGAYMTPEVIKETLTNPDFIIGLATRLKEEEAKTKELSARIQQDHPKVLFADSVCASETSILIGDLAKLIRQNGYEIGQKRLFEYLRNNGWLMKNSGSKNMPTQRALDMKLFEVLERTIDNPDGSIRIIRTTKCTGKGQIYFVNLFLGCDKAAKTA